MDIVQKMVNNIVENELTPPKQDLNKFQKIVPSLMKKGLANLDLSMFSPEIKHALLIVLGNEYESIAQYENCIEVYRLGEDHDSLLRLGKKMLEEGRIGHAIKSFIAIGDVARLKEIGDQCVSKFKFDYAFEIFSSIKDKERFIELGSKCIEQKEYAYALKAFELAASPEHLNQLGDTCLREEQISKALEAYSLAGNTMMSDFIKQNFSE